MSLARDTLPSTRRREPVTPVSYVEVDEYTERMASFRERLAERLAQARITGVVEVEDRAVPVSFTCRRKIKLCGRRAARWRK